MTTQAELQDLIRFLAKDARVPLAQALSLAQQLQGAHLTNPDAILAQARSSTWTDLISDSKLRTQIVSAARRRARKRAQPEPAAESPAKRSRSSLLDAPTNGGNDELTLETRLTLPAPQPADISDEELGKTEIVCNRAPWLLAFGVVVLRYTRPSQPLSARLSLAQAMISANARTKAQSLGLADGPSPEQDGWGAGQPVITVLGRQISVMRRYQGQDLSLEARTFEHPASENPASENSASRTFKVLSEEKASNGTTERPESTEQPDPEQEPPLWGLDLDALRRSQSGESPASSRFPGGDGSHLPIHRPEAARAYLLKQFASAPVSTDKSDGQTISNTNIHPDSPLDTAAKTKSSAKTKTETKTTTGKNKAQTHTAELENNAALVLTALDRLVGSWAPQCSATELHRRAWSWYVATRPEVAAGAAGWGGKGVVKLRQVLDLRNA